MNNFHKLIYIAKLQNISDSLRESLVEFIFTSYTQFIFKDIFVQTGSEVIKVLTYNWMNYQNKSYNINKIPSL